ncbi:MAG: DUF1801 domain-containing protein [Cytophagaceae bacterium]|jgi:hypothetical protein|nr:DUF1801 domain-containing protein [Cytophagaceae bacterium]
MQSTALTPDQYVKEVPSERLPVMNALRNIIQTNLPEGFEEIIQYGHIAYVVPHSLYPSGYHCDPKQALPFMSIASQKNFIAIYHMGLYADPLMMDWFVKKYSEHSNVKLDMGKSCLRFKKPEHVPLELIGELASKVSPAKWIAFYEANIKR